MSELRDVLVDTTSAEPAAADVAAPVVVESDTVTRADRWTRRAGERLAGEWQQLGVDAGDKIAEQEQYVAADAIETLLSPAPVLAENPADTHRAKWWQQLLESAELGALRSQTMLAPAVAELAAGEIARQWHAYAADNPEPEQQPDGDESGDEAAETPEQTIARMRSTRAAVTAAQETADDARAIAAGLGMGIESSVDARKLGAVAKRLKQSRVVARIMQLAGRFVALGTSLQRQRVNLPGMEVTGIELSGDVARVLPVEAAQIAGAVPEIEMLALYRLASRRTLSYRRDRREPVGSGPIIVSVDESGSMKGAPIEAAKGLALGMASIARAQKRPALFAAFSGSDVARWAGDSPDEIIEWCEKFLGGGTELDVPLGVVPARVPSWQHGAQADHIIITDAVVSETPKARALITSYQQWAKQHNVRTYAIVIGPSKPGLIAEVADGGVWCMQSLDLDSMAVSTVLSIGPSAARRSA